MSLAANKQDQAGALLLAWIIEILLKSIIPIKAKKLKKIIIGFLLCTGSFITFTLSLFINFRRSPPLVTIYDPQLFSGKK